MPIASMITDQWYGVRNDEQELANPSLEAVEQAIRALDASVRTLVLLEMAPESAAHMAVGGGHGQYIVYMTTDNVRFEQLTTDGPDEDCKVLLCAGGQEGEYAKRFVVGLEAALRAARRYVHDGEADPSLTWITK
jgi:hypothetical protein